ARAGAAVGAARGTAASSSTTPIVVRSIVAVTITGQRATLCTRRAGSHGPQSGARRDPPHDGGRNRDGSRPDRDGSGDARPRPGSAPRAAGPALETGTGVHAPHGSGCPPHRRRN